jgi:hypothetical protein
MTLHTLLDRHSSNKLFSVYVLQEKARVAQLLGLPQPQNSFMLLLAAF